MTARIRCASGRWALAALALGSIAMAACKGTSTLAPASASAASGRRPALSVAEPRHDVGSVLEGDPVKHVFTLRNVGEDLLTIKRAQGS